MAKSARLDEVAAARGVTLGPAQRAAVERVLEGGSAAWFRGRDTDVAPLIELAAALLPGAAIVFKPGLKAGKGWKAAQAARFAQHGAPLEAAVAQIKDADFTARAREANASLLVLSPAEQVLDALRALPEGMARFHAFYAALGRPPIIFESTQASQSTLTELASRLDIAAPEPVYLGYFRSNVMFEVLAAHHDERKPRLAARIAGELPGQGIFYCSGARQAKELGEFLREQGLECATAHPQQRAADRALAVDDFVKARVRLLVTAGFPGAPAARAARYCVHYDLPAGLEAYYFEAVSTGPGDKPARAVLLFERSDYAQQSARAEAKDPAPGEATALLALLKDAGVALPLSTWAEAAGLATKKARTLAGLLKDGGFVTEEKGGYRLIPGYEAKAVAATVLEYRAKRDAERRGFQDVVAYAESGLCRVKVLMRFFTQGEVEPCGLCDNCRKGKEQRVRAASRKHGERTAAGRWSRGDLVRHAAWGEGEVKQVWGDKLRVHFPGLGEKVIKAEFVHPPEA